MKRFFLQSPSHRFLSLTIFSLVILAVALPLLLNIDTQEQIYTQHADGTNPIKTVFVIVMENHNWAQINGSAPYITNTLLPMGAHAEQYYNPPGLHPSEPNYLWLEAGSNFGITNDNDPASNHIASTNHLVTQLTDAGIPWKAYVEDISGTTCPLVSSGLFAAKHTAMLFFDDVTNRNSAQSPYCIQHIRPYTQLATDVQNNSVMGYNFITPNLCDDMHNCSIATGDSWLSREVPNILNSQAYKNGGALFITWDEGEQNSDGPIGMIVESPFAKKGYTNTIHYTHSSLLKTLQEIFSVTPPLGDAANATDLRDFFTIPLNGTSTPSQPPATPQPTSVSPTHSPTVTASVSPTPLNAACSTVIPQGHTSIGAAIFLHGIGKKSGDNANPTSDGNLSPLHPQRNVTITILGNNSQPIASRQGCIAYTPGDGFFYGPIDMGNLASGYYLVTVKVYGFLAQQIPGIVHITSGQATIFSPQPHLATGDLNNDNQLDILDYNILIGCYGSKQTTPTCLAPFTSTSSGADITDDGVVDGIDYNEFLRELSVQRGA